MQKRQKVFSIFEQSKVTAQQKKLRAGVYADVDQAALRDFIPKIVDRYLSMGLCLRKKQKKLAKALNKPYFKTSDG